ncbi:F0F1 ATP synthase subunit B' [Paracoccus sediminicola]|uniref:F0F1 ATP synthase subunit B' n=1 Tax=Paracoccus sediminicola TaxID=3017783 RepID=UPI0022F12748|nr:F0F1 ATP synthase subunit B' [Paracoccus sediminicola]WBU58255.1 F0F1 ATP synthase subunit B' [Paracoccus sediminicola]
MFSLLQQAAETAVETGTHAEAANSEAAAAAAEHAAEPGIVVVEGADHAVAVNGYAAEAAESGGMPQLNPEYFGNLIFWLLVTLGVLYWVLSKVALPRIGSVITDRQGVITGDLMQAEEYKKKAKDAEGAYDKALADARSEAGEIIAAQKADIQKELDDAIAKADAEIAARSAESEKRVGAIRESAATDAREVAREVTAELVRRFGGKVDDAAIDAAVDARLKGAV